MSYIRTKYDGELTCPFCHRNFNWSGNLRRTRKRCVDNSGRPTDVFSKICANCDCKFEFAWGKVENKYEYRILECGKYNRLYKTIGGNQMKYTIERYINNVDGIGYVFCSNIFEELLCQMRDKIGLGEDYRNLIFVMNLPFYNRFRIACQAKGRDLDMYRGIRITVDSGMDMGGTIPCGIVRLVYEKVMVKDVVEAVAWPNYPNKIERGFYRLPHIDHIKFNGPATIVFWKDGTKTVVKHDGKGRKDKKMAVLYAFIRKIYGEGRPYHNILNEIEEAIK